MGFWVQWSIGSVDPWVLGLGVCGSVGFGYWVFGCAQIAGLRFWSKGGAEGDPRWVSREVIAPREVIDLESAAEGGD